MPAETTSSHNITGQRRCFFAPLASTEAAIHPLRCTNACRDYQLSQHYWSTTLLLCSTGKYGGCHPPIEVYECLPRLPALTTLLVNDAASLLHWQVRRLPSTH